MLDWTSSPPEPSPAAPLLPPSNSPELVLLRGEAPPGARPGGWPSRWSSRPSSSSSSSSSFSSSCHCRCSSSTTPAAWPLSYSTCRCSRCRCGSSCPCCPNCCSADCGSRCDSAAAAAVPALSGLGSRSGSQNGGGPGSCLASACCAGCCSAALAGASAEGLSRVQPAGSGAGTPAAPSSGGAQRGEPVGVRHPAQRARGARSVRVKAVRVKAVRVKAATHAVMDAEQQQGGREALRRPGCGTKQAVAGSMPCHASPARALRVAAPPQRARRTPPTHLRATGSPSAPAAWQAPASPPRSCCAARVRGSGWRVLPRAPYPPADAAAAAAAQPGQTESAASLQRGSRRRPRTGLPLTTLFDAGGAGGVAHGVVPSAEELCAVSRGDRELMIGKEAHHFYSAIKVLKAKAGALRAYARTQRPPIWRPRLH